MNIVVLQGTLSREPVERTLPSGTTVADWNVSTVLDGSKLSVPVQWTDPNRAVQQFGEGDEVIVTGAVRQRFFRANGMLASRTEVVGRVVTKPTQRVATSKLLDHVAQSLNPHRPTE